jgi:hypothetical protein
MNILIIQQNHNHPNRALSSNHKFCWVVCSLTIFVTSSSGLIEKTFFMGESNLWKFLHFIKRIDKKGNSLYALNLNMMNAYDHAEWSI